MWLWCLVKRKSLGHEEKCFCSWVDFSHFIWSWTCAWGRHDILKISLCQKQISFLFFLFCFISLSLSSACFFVPRCEVFLVDQWRSFIINFSQAYNELKQSIPEYLERVRHWNCPLALFLQCVQHEHSFSYFMHLSSSMHSQSSHFS